MSDIDEIVNIKANLDELHILMHTGQAIPWGLVKMILCGLASTLTIVCKLMPEIKGEENVS